MTYTFITQEEIGELIKKVSNTPAKYVSCEACKKRMKFEGTGQCPDCNADPYNRKKRY